ncbi:winged helix-turn-helix domain-containing protein [Natronomonas sp. EA1]|uniref:winged helix-turn-helix domain-containing protein n=1 Tax=Natronomonas sp. EA1 TaxID=3421655 RepID=UPI003EB92DB5
MAQNPHPEQKRRVGETDGGAVVVRDDGGLEAQYDEDRLAALRAVLEPRTLRILQQLLASETGALSPKEVAFRNNDITESTVRDHLRSLTDRDLVEKLEPEVETVPNRIPRTYYAVSEYGIELLKQVGMYDGLAILYQVYQRMDRPEEIRIIEEWENRPRPDWL